jgi:antagonist of KipI
MCNDGHTAALRVVPGPEAEWFSSALKDLCERFPPAAFTVRPESNRMGLRLSGPLLPVPSREMVSQPVAPGAVQVTPDGQAILLGVDGQTIGGYPRIGHVISADLDVFGQLRPGDQVVFERVTLPEAERLARQKQELLKRWWLRLCEAAAAS